MLGDDMTKATNELHQKEELINKLKERNSYEQIMEILKCFEEKTSSEEIVK